MELDISTDVWNKVAGNFSQNLIFKHGNINVIERIGSESSEGEVYRIHIQGQEYAGKIMPINSAYSVEKNENEISISKELSNLTYFPIVYTSIFSENTKYNEKSLFLEDSYKYFLFKRENMSKRIRYLYRNMNLQELQNVFPIPLQIEAHVLISEITYSDLRQFRCGNENIWIFIILDVLKGIKYLNEEKNILHGDLHCGNVLIKVNDKNEIQTPLISDFGKSKRCLFENMQDRVTDAEKFLYDLTLHFDVPKNIKDKIEEILNYISCIYHSKTSYPIMDEIISLFKRGNS